MTGNQKPPFGVEQHKPSYGILKQRFYRKALQLQPQTHFTCLEIEGLLRIFEKIVEKYQSPMTKLVYKDVLFNLFGMTNDAMMEKMFLTLTNGNQIMSYDDWIRGLNIILRGTSVQLAHFAFSILDNQKREILSKEDVQYYLRDILVAQIADEDAEECRTDMLDMVFVLLDQDKDGYISRRDFVRSILSQPLLMYILGDCLPSPTYTTTLDSLIKEDRSTCETVE